MTTLKKIICLSNSIKISGRCIAGKEYIGTNPGDWIRPISCREFCEISETEREYENGQTAQVLDIIKIPCKEHKPSGCQCENYLIDDNYYWEKEGEFSFNKLVTLLDEVEGNIWVNNYSSYYGINDRIPIDLSDLQDSSLLMIEPTELQIVVRSEGEEFGNAKRKVRGFFIYNNQEYFLSVTDPIVKREFLGRPNGEYTIDNPKYLCISLGEEFQGYRYKLIATVFYKTWS